ncbi:MULTISPECIES: hypothetical protein [Cyanophyceae]|uniref:hypothetical protein n=1 Tax=Cyanophyceae TaxID=3028117 RepID=UPI001687DC75|nr:MULTISPECIES: hypothetical protein [Cyanophyceae]MBD1918206.1 hypothetical protein [Phormidium sp. FACHB-77]MBD2030238.1 hypothetical protein [Phormidium sp. FACHB-322]MBD2051390.1 hypothetical protein [Leptolyngbya sp. FACHB-60]
MQKSNPFYVEMGINPRRIFLILVGIVMFASLGHIVVRKLNSLLDIESTPLVGIYNFFNMSVEANFPTYISAINLLIAALLCGLIAFCESNLKKRYTWHWWGLAACLLILSLDEAAQIHEGIVGSILGFYVEQGQGIFYYKWYLAYIPVLAILSFLYLPFLKHLPLRYSSKFVLSAFVYFGGAIGFEMVQAYLSYHSRSTGLSVLVEETLEMLGVVIVIYTLLLYLSEQSYALKLKFAPEENFPSHLEYSQSRRIK